MKIKTMKIKTITLLGILLTLSIFTMASCVASTGTADAKDPAADVSAENCADATAALNCFISTWDTTKTGDGASATSAVELPLVENGAYNFYVDWGDGTATENITGYDDTKAAHTHEYEKSGEYTIHIAGEIKGWRFYVEDDNYGDAVKLLDVTQWGSLSLGNTAGRQFRGAENFNPTATDAPDVSETTSLVSAFNGASNFNADISDWDVGEVTDMSFMFNYASSFNNNGKPLDWGKKTSKVTFMNGMFDGASNFNVDISNWDVSQVTAMNTMFRGASVFNQDICYWNVGNVTPFASIGFALLSALDNKNNPFDAECTARKSN